MVKNELAFSSSLYHLTQTGEEPTREKSAQLLAFLLKEHYPEKWREEVTVVVPCKNEEPTIGWVVKLAKPFCKELIVVDGASTDRSALIAADCGAKVVSAQGNGKGRAMRQALSQVTTSVVVFMDADGSHHPYDIPLLVSPIFTQGAHHVIGSRNLAGSEELHGDWEKFLRMTGSSIITVAINYRYRVRLTDSQNGFRAIQTKVFRTLNLKSNITTIEQEMTMETLRRGFTIVEVPTHEYARQAGVSHIVLRQVWWQYVSVWLKGLMKRRVG